MSELRLYCSWEELKLNRRSQERTYYSTRDRAYYIVRHLKTPLIEPKGTKYCEDCQSYTKAHQTTKELHGNIVGICEGGRARVSPKSWICIQFKSKAPTTTEGEN